MGALAACRELSLEPAYWSGWGQDWNALSGERIGAISCTDLDAGSILLLHDSARYNNRPSAPSHRRGDSAHRGSRA